MKAIAHFFLLFAFTSLGLAAEEARESQVDDIREAVFRYQFDHNASGQQKSWCTNRPNAWQIHFCFHSIAPVGAL
jgi:hypothetical protein